MPPEENPYNAVPPVGQAAGPVSVLGRLPGDKSLIKRIIVVAGGIIVLIIIALIFSGILSNASKSGTTTFAAVASDQSELSSIGMLANEDATSQAAKNLAGTIADSSGSDKALYLKTLSKDGIKLSKSQTTTTNSTIASELKTANTDGIFDITFVQTVQSEVGTYKSDLSAAFKISKNATTKNLLSSFYNEAQLYLTAANQVGQSLSS